MKCYKQRNNGSVRKDGLVAGKIKISERKFQKYIFKTKAPTAKLETCL